MDEEKKYYAIFEVHWKGFDGGIALLSKKDFPNGSFCKCKNWLFTVRSDTKDPLISRIYTTDQTHNTLLEAQERLIQLIFVKL